MSNATTSPASERIRSLLDENSFVEIGAGVTARSTDFNMAEKKAPSDGVITGYGLVDGSLVYVYSQDASVLKGTIGEMHAKKIVNLYNFAMKTGAPVIGLIDCAGMRLEEATDGLHAFGELYRAQVDASGVIPQITGIFGMCGGGMALIPAITDFTLMEQSKAKLFVNAPNAIKGNSEDKCDTAAAEYQASESGLVDFTGTEEEIILQIRNLVMMLPANNEDDMAYAVCSDDLNRVSDDIAACAADPILLLQRISDNGAVFEAKASYAQDMVTALIKLNGYTVGAIANRSAKYAADGSVEKFDKVISGRGARKAADFVKFCDAFSIPIVTFTNVKGFSTYKCSESLAASYSAKLTAAFIDATTPKVNVITEEAFGSAYLVMNSKSTGADLVFAWDGAKIGMMDAASAAKIMYDGADAETVKEQTAAYNELQNSVESAAARGYVDTVIAPAETRKYLIGALDMLFTKREFRPDKKHSTI